MQRLERSSSQKEGRRRKQEEEYRQEWLGARLANDLLERGSSRALLANVAFGVAAGATVTTLDNSPRQLEQDRLVAAREGLAIETVQGEPVPGETVAVRAASGA